MLSVDKSSFQSFFTPLLSLYPSPSSSLLYHCRSLTEEVLLKNLAAVCYINQLEIRLITEMPFLKNFEEGAAAPVDPSEMRCIIKDLREERWGAYMLA